MSQRKLYSGEIWRTAGRANEPFHVTNIVLNVEQIEKYEPLWSFIQPEVAVKPCFRPLL